MIEKLMTVREFNRQVDLKHKEFTEWMVSLLKDREDLQVLFQEAEKDPKMKRDLLIQLFAIWLNDPGRVEWFINHEIIERGL